jgi:hypothetical protein
MCGGESPDKAIPGQAILDMGVCSDIWAIIEVDKPVALHLPKRGPNSHSEKQTYKNHAAGVNPFMHYCDDHGILY